MGITRSSWTDASHNGHQSSEMTGAINRHLGAEKILEPMMHARMNQT